MKKHRPPHAKIVVRDDYRSVLTPSALSRWQSGLKASADEEADNTISVLDVIGSDWFGEGVTAKRISAALRSIGNRDVVVNINSPGGDYFEGLAIYNMLREHPAQVTVKVLGIAASAASIIAMAGDEVKIGRAGFLMIHNTWVVAMGDRHALAEASDWLEPFDASAADIYAARSGIEAKDIAKMMDRETWINGSSAVDQGFADSLLSADEVDQKAKASGEARELHALRELENYLAVANCPRAKRGELLSAMKGGKRDAAAAGLRDAALVSGVEEMLADLKKL